MTKSERNETKIAMKILKCALKMNAASIRADKAAEEIEDTDFHMEQVKPGVIAVYPYVQFKSLVKNSGLAYEIVNSAHDWDGGEVCDLQCGLIIFGGLIFRKF